MTKNLLLVDFEAGMNEDEALEAKRRWDCFNELLLVARSYKRITETRGLYAPNLDILIQRAEEHL